jgi:hypothetical protein
MEVPHDLTNGGGAVTFPEVFLNIGEYVALNVSQGFVVGRHFFSLDFKKGLPKKNTGVY